ncbi:MAG: ornithine cyclodeaminase [Chloroflexi bacterium]|nr:ornithine cyclodeaminase [Chloroflexota bacterium]
MPLLLARHEVEPLIDPAQAIRVLETVVREEVEGTTVHVPPFGGTGGRRNLVRIVGGGLLGMGRMGLRAGLRDSVALIWELDTWELLAIIGYPFSHMRVGATMAMAAGYLARPDASCIGLLGSGQNALDILVCMRAVRPIQRVEMYSPTPEHRVSFAKRAAAALGIPVTDHDAPEPDQLRPGTHVSSMGVETEVDPSVYLRATQIVAGARGQELVTQQPRHEPRTNSFFPGGPLYFLIEEGKLTRESVIELGDLVRGAVAPINGPTDVTLFRESRGGVGDMALANWAYERAKELGIGVPFDFT